MEIYIAQETRWTMACKQTLTALNWVKVVHLARECFICDQRCVDGRGHVVRRIISTLVARASSWKNHEAEQRQVSLFDAHGGNRFFVDDTLPPIRFVAWCVMHTILPQAPRTLYVHIQIYFSFICFHSSTIYLYASKRSASDLSLCAFRFYKRSQLLWNLWRYALARLQVLLTRFRGINLWVFHNPSFVRRYLLATGHVHWPQFPWAFVGNGFRIGRSNSVREGCTVEGCTVWKCHM